ncbi:efflux RND transporter periplasmic adaptor subunit [Crateriforma conspicua]|uniref:Multidrug resistance protein MdtN n=1 Tax=Crateriforma conspicua TaxID=2527996 RepID=A0A5C5XZU2_9PLAN|nr:HlyD family efflux transporter periplasmic adaptor subunit [Crateriforma conspicua]TWT67951.1 multidrug resistance protein MdtN [Crateriforma conspicua]
MDSTASPTVADPDNDRTAAGKNVGPSDDTLRAEDITFDETVPPLPRSHSRGSRMLFLLLFNVVVPLLLLAAGAAVMIALGSATPETQPLPGSDRASQMMRMPSINVAQVQSLETLGGELDLTVDGTVVPYREVTIATEVAGRIVYKSDLCEAGSVVKAGTVLMRIDKTDYELEVERLTRQREQAYQSIRETEQESLGTQRLIDVAKDDLELQTRELKRQQSLPKGFASQGEIDQAQRAVLAANQQIVTLENQLSLQQKRLITLQASLRLAETQLRSAEVNLQRTEITAPIDGVIVREDAELNTFVNRGNTIVTIEDTSKVEVAAQLRMDQVYWLTTQNRTDSGGENANGSGAASADLTGPGQGYQLPNTPATIEYEMSGRRAVYRWDGHLMGFDGIGLDAATRTVPVRILVDAPSEYRDATGQVHHTAGPTALVRGMFVTVRLHLKPNVPLYVIPEKAIKPGNRLWHFSADESVFDLPSSEESQDVAPETVVASDNEPSQSTNADTKDANDNGFDPSRWIPGRVKVVESIIPVDRLNPKFAPSDSVTAEATERDDSFVAETTDWWICEIPDGDITDGSMVVLSPLPAIPRSGLPARTTKPDANAAAPAKSETQE